MYFKLVFVIRTNWKATHWLWATVTQSIKLNTVQTASLNNHKVAYNAVKLIQVYYIVHQIMIVIFFQLLLGLVMFTSSTTKCRECLSRDYTKRKNTQKASILCNYVNMIAAKMLTVSHVNINGRWLSITQFRLRELVPDKLNLRIVK